VREDLAGLLAIYNDVIATSTAVYRDDPTTLAERERWWHARIAAGLPVLVAVDDADVVGFASYGEFRAWPGYRYTVEHTVHVSADRRGRGIGGALMRPLIQRAAQAGKHVMIAGVDAENEGSIRFHLRLGFTRVGRFHEVGFKFGRWLDLVFLQRLLV
jgi:phosphinothricin acetyltransferase